MRGGPINRLTEGIELLCYSPSVLYSISPHSYSLGSLFYLFYCLLSTTFSLISHLISTPFAFSYRSLFSPYSLRGLLRFLRRSLPPLFIQIPPCFHKPLFTRRSGPTTRQVLTPTTAPRPSFNHHPSLLLQPLPHAYHSPLTTSSP
jgi:hypothetical protein